MLSQLKFVQGAVAAKDLIPGLTHFRIKDGTVRSYNGTLAICSPVALDLDCSPKADALVKAIENCEEATTLSLTAGGKLRVRSGSFTALVPLIADETPHVLPAGNDIQFDGEQVLKAFKVLEPFISTDASRPFTTGILLDGGSAYATNNVCIGQYWLGASFPYSINVPRKAVKEVLRVGEAPTHAQLDQDSITFHYSDGRWIRSQLLRDVWPLDKISQILDAPNNPVPIPAELFKGLAKVKDMADGSKRVYLKDGALRTSVQDDDGAIYDLGLPFDGCYNMQMLGLLEGVVSTIDMTLYPEPCIFYGERLRGAIIGMSM